MPTEHIKYEDTLRQGTDKINNAIDQANKAEEDSAEALDTANQALQNSESTQTQLDTIVIEGDSSVEAAQARVDADGNAYTTLKERLDTEHTEVTAQLADIAVNVRKFGAVGDGVTDDTEAFKNALSIANNHKYTLLIPEGTYLITSEINICCNVNCLGEIIVPNSGHVGNFIVLPFGERVEVEGEDFFTSNKLLADNTIFEINTPSGINDLGDYYFVIRSEEKLVTRFHEENLSYYTKDEGGEIVRQRGNFIQLRTPLLYNHDTSQFKIVLSKKTPTINVNGLKIKRYNSGGKNEHNQQLLTIQRNNVIFNNTEIVNGENMPLYTGLRLDNTHNIIFNTLKIENIYGDLGTNYPIGNSRSAFIYFNHYNYKETNHNSRNERGYTARHGNYVYFNNSFLYGIDDHYGSNYYVINTEVGNRGITYSGKNLTLIDSIINEAYEGIVSRADIGHNEGKLYLKNCTFIGSVYPIRHKVPEVETPDQRQPVFPLRFYDEIILENVQVKRGSRGQDIAGVIQTPGSNPILPDHNYKYGNITLKNVHTYNELIRLIDGINVEIDGITLDNCSHGESEGILIRKIGNHDKIVDKIVIKDSDDVSIHAQFEPSINNIEYRNTDFSNNKSNLIVSNPDTIISFKESRLGDANYVLDCKAKFLDCLFASDNIINENTEILMANNNRVKAGISSGIPPLNISRHITIDGGVVENLDVRDIDTILIDSPTTIKSFLGGHIGKKIYIVLNSTVEVNMEHSSRLILPNYEDFTLDISTLGITLICSNEAGNSFRVIR